MSNADRIRSELETVNERLVKMGAVRTEDDGFQWVDETVCGKALADFYSGLRSAAYALGAVR